MTLSVQTQAVLAQPVLLKAGQSLDFSRLHEVHRQRYPFILESVAKGGLSHHSIAHAYPQETIQLNPEHLAQSESFVTRVQQAFAQANAKPEIKIQFNSSDAADMQRVQASAANLPFKGGWFAYFSYDYAQVVEPVLHLPVSEFPLASLVRTPAAIVLDEVEQIAWLLVESPFYEAHPESLQQMFDDLMVALIDSAPYQNAATIQIDGTTEELSDKYLSGVEAIKEYILAGDVFQVNLSRLWQVELQHERDYLQVYRALCRHNPAPFAALVCLQDGQGNPWQIISSSPERLAKFDGEWVDTRPIAGTRRRSEDEAADQALMDELIAHPKERAEHIMLIDLERNDLGRICQPGTVEVNELMVIESYQHVHHIVSNVRGKLRDGFSPLDIVHALFPGGTITGCPKVRCMEIVAELEQMPREAYTGSLGYINLDGTMDLNILIRTMISHTVADKTELLFRAGAGIVADSNPDFELVETRHKARGLLRALGDSEA